LCGPYRRRNLTVHDGMAQFVSQRESAQRRGQVATEPHKAILGFEETKGAGWIIVKVEGCHVETQPRGQCIERHDLPTPRRCRRTVRREKLAGSLPCSARRLGFLRLHDGFHSLVTLS